MPSKNEVTAIAAEAEAAFWQAVARQSIDIKTGDLNPLDSIAFSAACEKAVEQWLSSNSETFPREKTGDWDITASPFYARPHEFLKEGQRCRAIRRVYDLPGCDNPGPIHAEVGDEGVVVYWQIDRWPTVRFDKTQTSSCVSDFEVEPL